MAQRRHAMLEVMRDSIQAASDADVNSVPGDSANKSVILYDEGGIERNRFFWKESRLHYGVGLQDHGPITPTIVERFNVSFDKALGILNVDTLRVRSSAGQQVTLSTSIGLYNK
jgi:hypothetical protein